MMAQKLRDDDYVPLLELRSKIQKIQFFLLRYLKENEKDFSDTSAVIGQTLAFSVLQKLVGINLSLWRYLFLIFEDRSQTAKIKAMIGMIEGLLTDNTLSFAREVEAQAWIGSYYGNNARIRINAIFEQLIALFDSSDEILLTRAKEFKVESKKYFGLADGSFVNRKPEVAFVAVNYLIETELMLIVWLDRYSIEHRLKGISIDST